MTRIELARLAAAINVLRPDWPTPSLQTFLGQHLHRPLLDVAVALTWVATDPDTKTPARLNEAGPWWQASRTADVPQAVNDCPRHPETGLRLDPVTGRTSCAGCHVDAHADDSGTIRDRGGKPIPDQARQVLAPVLERPGPQNATPDNATSARPDAGDAVREEAR